MAHKAGPRLLVEVFQDLGDVLVGKLHEQLIANGIGELFQHLGLIGRMQELDAGRGQFELAIGNQPAQLVHQLLTQVIAFQQ